MQNPRVSILLPAFDAEDTLPASLESIRRQSEARFECLVVDDGSSDGTARVARAFAKRDPRFRVLTRDHAGIVPSLNAGLAACRAPWVARMDADDLMYRQRLGSRTSRTSRVWAATSAYSRAPGWAPGWAMVGEATRPG